MHLEHVFNLGSRKWDFGWGAKITEPTALSFCILLKRIQQSSKVITLHQCPSCFEPRSAKVTQKKVWVSRQDVRSSRSISDHIGREAKISRQEAKPKMPIL
jgi:hypothetical protein